MQGGMVCRKPTQIRNLSAIVSGVEIWAEGLWATHHGGYTVGGLNVTKTNGYFADGLFGAGRTR